MKTKIYTLLFSVALMFAVQRSNAQVLVQFWDFNQIRPIGGAGGDSLGTVFSYANNATTDSNMATWPLTPVYSKVAGGKILYIRPQFHYNALVRDSILDGVGPGGSFIYDYSSSHYAYLTSSDSGFAEGNGYLKVRNPSDSCYMYIIAPTTGYKNISFQFAISQSSTKGAQYNIFSYSVNGGTNWKNLTTAMDTFNIGGHAYPDTLQVSNPITSGSNWYPCQINFSSDASVNNNALFVVRIRIAGSNSYQQSGGNDRYDNFAFWATGPAGINELSAEDAGYNVYPNPANDNITLYGTHAGEKLVTIYNVIGQQISTVKVVANQNLINVSQLSQGVYFMNIRETETGNNYTLKFVKE